MASRHKVVKLRSRNRHVTVTPLQRPKPSAPWQLDVVNERLRRGDETLALPPKVFAVLRHLHEHPGRLVTKQELLDAVWPDIAVTEAVLKNCILKLREALDDNAKSPRYIETIHRRGYRLLTPLPATPPVSSSTFQVPPPPTSSSEKEELSSSQLGTWNQKPETPLVGRETELSQLHGWLEKALKGERKVVFVSGEAGIGKTTVVEAFLKQVTAEKNLWIGRGQCIEHYGAGEGYMPVLEALGRLCREPGREELIPLLSRHAPTWLAQMPALLSTADLDALQRKVAGVTRERMLREMAEALEALTAKRPLVLLLEDLHWSDVSTLELLSVLARRHEAARLLVLGTYRPVEMLANGHPLRTVKQELQQHRQCEEQRLDFLTEAHVAEYLARRFEGGVRRAAPLQELARAVHQRTEGNALFMVNVVEYLLPQGDLEEAGENVQVGMPSDLRQMIEEQIHRLSLAEQRMLEVASVAGAECSAAAIAAGLGATVEEVEAQCEGLARREQFLRRQGKEEWPDGIVAARYSFLHALYQEALYERVTVARRSSLHRRIGERQEQAYGERAKELAAELAVHFERGREYRKAVQYLQHAGENALRRSANQEAVSLLTKGLELLKTLPDTPERTQQELTLQLALGNALITVKGYTTPDVEKTYTRARALCQQLGETLQLIPVLVRLVLFYFDRGEFRTARELAEQALQLAQSVRDRYLLSLAHMALGFTVQYVGEFTSAQPHLEQALALYDPQQHPRLTVPRGDPRVECLCFATWNLWYLGYPDQALKRIQEAVALAEGISHPLSLAYALLNAALFHLSNGEEQLAREGAAAVITLATEQGFPYWLAFGMVTRGAALAAQGQGEEGIAQMQQGLAVLQAMGAEQARNDNLIWLAITYGRGGQVEEGLAVVAEALAVVDKTGVRLHEAGLYIVKGLLLLAHPGANHTEAEACFRQAIAVARRQSAKFVELRAVMSLSRLWQTQGKKKEAHRMLAEIYGWFTEGFDTKDLQDAKALLEKLQD